MLVFLQETHILNTFENPLHGQLLKVCILDYIRPEANFNSIGEYTYGNGSRIFDKIFGNSLLKLYYLCTACLVDLSCT